MCIGFWSLGIRCLVSSKSINPVSDWDVHLNTMMRSASGVSTSTRTFINQSIKKMDTSNHVTKAAAEEAIRYYVTHHLKAGDLEAVPELKQYLDKSHANTSDNRAAQEAPATAK